MNYGLYIKLNNEYDNYLNQQAIKNCLSKYKINHYDSGLFIGELDVNEVKMILAVQKLNQLEWFKLAVDDINMLRITDITNLKEVLN